MLKRFVFTLTFFISLISLPVLGQSEQSLQKNLESFFENYKPQSGDYQVRAKLQNYKVDDENHVLTVTASDQFSEQEFSPEIVDYIYKRIKRSLSDPYNSYTIRVRTHGMEINQLIPNRLARYKDASRTWGNIEYKGHPWVKNESKPHEVSHGLQNRHLSIAASHGRYYDKGKGRWKWQRPNLFCTTEDLFTQTIVVPYLIPMLENAGAVVFSPRERDWQRHEAIVDNDDGRQAPYYTESNGWTTAPGSGFAYHRGTYQDQENPFVAGTARMTQTTTNKHATSTINYQPDIPADGKYAVYVSYKTVENSVDDAQYIVTHKGQQTVFTVNQQMGGSTWVYLGTFEFGQGCTLDNRVTITNQSRHHGVVTADAVRFGGGRGNISRGGSTSGLARSFEGSRYTAQWSGAPYSVYSCKEGKDDYSDDINVRSFFSNWIAGGSCYVPNTEGKKVPLELELAIHSDAGFDKNGGNDLIGTLSICTTNYNDGVLSAGISRMASRDFADALLANVYHDLKGRFSNWKRRVMYDRNYSESRLPAVPSAILETMSHQNFGDLRYGFDPNFRFALARSIYKTILRFVNEMHGKSFIVQPLRPNNFRIEFASRNRIKLSWNGVKDPQEPTATPTAFNLYTAKGNGGFDNGTTIKGNACHIDLQPNTVYHFKVTAVNQGGESFPTEVLSAYYQPNAQQTVLVVNGFNRLSGPAIIDGNGQKGFDLNADPGVTYGPMPGWAGRQTVFDNSQRGKEGPGALGYCGDELTGRYIAGNDFNYVQTHANAIASTRHYNVVSCSKESVETGQVKLSKYDCVDLVLGLEKDDGHSLLMYKTFTPRMQQVLSQYVKQHGSLLVSGSYIGADMTERQEQAFLSNVLKVRYAGSDQGNYDNGINGLNCRFNIHRALNEQHYAATAPDILQAVNPAFCAMLYSDQHSAAVAYQGNDYRSFTMGFPFECITEEQQRNQLMLGILNFLLNKKKPVKR